MRKFRHIESWASHLGYVVEKHEENNEVKYVWYKERVLEFNVETNIQNLIENIIKEIKSSYEGSE